MVALWETTLVSIIVLISVFLGFLVYFKDKRNLINRYFLTISLLSAVWIGSAFLSEFFPLTNPSLAIFLSKITYGAVIWWVIFLLFFALIFPQKKKVISSKFFGGLFIFLGFILSGLILFTSLLVEGMEIQPWGFDVVYGKIFPIFATFATFLIIAALINFIESYIRIKGFQREQLKYFFLGFGIFLIALIFFNVVLLTFTGIEKYYRFGNYSAIFFLGFTAYAIVARQLFDIRVILSEILVGVIAIILFIQMMTADILWLKILNGSVFILFCVFGYLLIKATIREIEMRREVERLSNAKSEFISIASHQLRTPLTAVKGYISMILEGTYGQLAEKQARPLENVYKSNERLIKLVNDLLSVSRIESGKLKLEPQKTSIEEIISNVVEELKIEAKKKNIYLNWEKPHKPLPKILIDIDKTRQVILNIVDNAIKYTKQGGVTVSTKIQDSRLKIQVKDTGEGMTEKEISYLFESFSRGKAGTHLYSEGAGLGLYIARKFVEMHQGKIWAESKGKDKGSTFYIELPIK